MNIGDLVEYSYLFKSDLIDHWTKDNKACFIILEEYDEDRVWGKLQFPLNAAGELAWSIAEVTVSHPNNNWLLEKKDCRVISEGL